jgi:hypothetical protein
LAEEEILEASHRRFFDDRHFKVTIISRRSMKLARGFETSNTSDSPDIFCQQLRLAEEIESRGKPTSFF